MKIIAEYDCPECGILELEHSHKINKKKCPECGSKIQRLISAPIISKMNDPRTLGTLGERNAKRNPLSATRGISDEDRENAKTLQKLKKINNMTPEQKNNYIETGKGIDG